MKAILREAYGSPSVLRLGEVETPAPAGDQLLIRVRAVSVNPLDWHYVRGRPYLMRIALGIAKPTSPLFGADFAGVVEAVGPLVQRFKPGDEVFGAARGSFAEYVAVSEAKGVAAKPSSVTFEQAASLPVAGLTALQALRDQGQVRPGQRVLINGASGGVGTMAVQIARSMGAEVAGVCSNANVDLVRSLGTVRVFDYTREDFAASGEEFDVLLDNVGNRSLSDCRRVLKPRGTYIANSGGSPDDNRWGFGMIAGIMGSIALSAIVDHKLRRVLARVNQEDLAALADLVETGRLTAVIDKRSGLHEIPRAISHLETSRARGKVVISL